MKKILFISMILFAFLTAKSQQTVVSVHQIDGSVIPSTLGANGKILFTAQGEQMAIIDNTGIVRGYGLSLVEKVIFLEDFGLEDINTEALTLYPNPTNGLITLNNVDINQEVEVYNLEGSKIMSQKINPSKQFDISHLPSGVYLIRQNNKATKIVKE